VKHAANPNALEGSASGARRLRSVCVFCGSSPGHAPLFAEAARSAGELLARRGLALVYGGGHIGMMGALADAALAAGARVTGVIPKHLMRPEVAHLGLSELIVVQSMHERKQLMADRCDAFLVLPGGYGTLDETFEMLTWQQLGLQRKPVAAINVAGYFDGLQRWIHHSVEAGFVHPSQSRLLMVEATAEAALARLEQSLARPGA
jgi:uncharacterized protein (TIGR00730 family)